jgi:GAF domain-containing protein
MSSDADTGLNNDLRWRLLASAKNRLSQAHSVAEIVEVVRGTARSICGADGVTFVLRDGDKCHYVEEDAIGPLWRGQKFPLASCISGWCMLNDRTVSIQDIYRDVRIPHDAYKPTFVKSLIMTPVRTNSPVAAIGAYWGERRSFSGREKVILESLAESVGAAMLVAKAA